MRKERTARCSIRGRFPSLSPNFGDGSPQPPPSRRNISGTLPQRAKALSGTVPLNFGDGSPYVWAGRDVFRGRFPSITGTVPLSFKEIGDDPPHEERQKKVFRGRFPSISGTVPPNAVPLSDQMRNVSSIFAWS